MKAQLSKRRRLGTFRLGETVSHNIPTGFWSLRLDDLDDAFGDSLADNLDMIWTGAGGSFKAADFALPYAGGDLWGNVGQGQTSDDVQPNVDAWKGLLDHVVAYNAANGTAMRVVISRELNGMVTGPPAWSVTGQLREYVDKICDVLNADSERKNVCMGWYLADDTFGSTIGSYNLATPGAYDPDGDVETWRDILDEVQARQTAKGINLPYFFDYNIHFTWPRGVVGGDWIKSGGNIVYDTWFPPVAGGYVTNDNAPPPRLYRKCDLNPTPAYSGWFLNAIRKQSKGGAFPNDAKRVLMPYMFPWGGGTAWGYTVMPPWLYWKELLRALMAEFKDDPDVQIQPMLETSQQSAGARVPGHADHHKQLRVVLDLAELDIGNGQTEDARNRITALWYVGWTDPEARVSPQPWPGYEQHAKKHWVAASTYNEQWAEATQTEIGDLVTQPSSEDIAAAAPADTRLMSSDMDNAFTTGIRVPYQLATAGHVLIRVSQGTDTICEIEEGFGGKSPVGYYDRHPNENPLPAAGSSTRLRGTSAYWDGQKGDPDYPFQSGVYVSSGNYTVTLYVDGVAEGSKIITKP